MEVGLPFPLLRLTGPRRGEQAARTVNRDTLSTIATVIVAVVALGAFVRDEIGDVRAEIADVRDDIAEVRRDMAREMADVRADITGLRADVADLRERMVRVEVLLGVSRNFAGELAPGPPKDHASE